MRLSLFCLIYSVLTATAVLADEIVTVPTNGLFNVARVPFSYFSSWSSISIPRKTTELYFRSHHDGEQNIFPLQVLSDGEVVVPEITATPWMLVLRHGEGQVEICFERPGTIRMRGRGLGLRFGGENLAYSEGPNLVTVNAIHIRRYQVEMLKGAVSLRQLVETQPVFPMQVVISPAEDGQWELAMDEYWSTWRRPERAGFDECAAGARKAFNTFLGSMPEAQPQYREARELAAYILWSATVGPCGLIKRPTVFMSKNWMCNVWSWDQCFNAMALSRGQPDLALDQMLTLVDHQDEFGSYPDSINDIMLHYSFSKPPVHGLVFREMLDRMQKPPSREIMETMYRSLGRQADWWLTYRVQKTGKTGRPLPYYLHGNDSGWDNSTMFAKGVPLIAPDLSALLVTQMDTLAFLAERLGKPDEAVRWTARADQLQKDMIGELWRGNRFVARLAVDGTDVESDSLIPCLPIIMGKRLPEEMRATLKEGIAAHLTDWGLATEKISSPRYAANGYWRGPVWAPSTWIAVTGLDRSGYGELADTIARRFCRMCAKSGFAENFNAITGDPLCDPAYTWTASVFLLLAERDM